VSVSGINASALASSTTVLTGATLTNTAIADVTLQNGTTIKAVEIGTGALTLTDGTLSGITVTTLKGAGAITVPATFTATNLNATGTLTISGGATSLDIVKLSGSGTVTLPDTLAILKVGGTGTVATGTSGVKPSGVITLYSGADITIAASSKILHGTVLQLDPGRYRAVGNVTITAGVIATVATTGEFVVGADDANSVALKATGNAATSLTPSAAITTLSNDGISLAATAVLTLNGATTAGASLAIKGTSKLVAGDAATKAAATDWIDITNVTLLSDNHADGDIVVTAADGTIAAVGSGSADAATIKLFNGSEINTKGSGSIIFAGSGKLGKTTSAGGQVTFSATGTASVDIVSTTAATGTVTVPATGNLTLGAGTDLFIGASTVGSLTLVEHATAPAKLTLNAATAVLNTGETSNGAASGSGTKWKNTETSTSGQLWVNDASKVAVATASSSAFCKATGGTSATVMTAAKVTPSSNAVISSALMDA
jgi:hypothetical protein